MMLEVQRLLDDYAAWLRDKTVLRELDGWVEITTPFLDRHNDYLQIYAKRSNGGFVLTDDGHTLADLEQGGVRLEKGKRRDVLNLTLNGFGVRLEGGELQTHASADNFSLRKHSLVQAILAVNDLFYLASPTVASLFHEDVGRWLDLHEVRNSPNVSFTGKTGYVHVFDYLIPKSKHSPERILKTINRPSRDSAQTVVLAWFDTREVRPSDSRAYAILNDTEQPVSSAVTDALRSYDVRAVPWSQREQVREELAA